MRHKQTIAALTLAIVLSGCAVRMSQAPQIPPAVAWELNTAAQLEQLERDYRTFFKDVGAAQRKGTLTQEQADMLFAVGHKMKPAIERANLAFKTWQAAKSEEGKLQVTQLVLAATQIFLELSTKKAEILTGGGA
ncbi:MAG: hypothetical protein L0312_26660 [Acidobacteria bacterium]|nr:hypothetical protein [Acidobacteriota bacterium]